MDKVINELLGYEKLKIVQSPETFNFSIDSMLLANFCTIKKTCNKIVDFCTGNAPVLLYISLRLENLEKKQIYGIELQKTIYDLAIESIKLNKLDDFIKILNRDVKGISKEINNVDLVTCNPPYFKYILESKTNKNEYLTIARHELKITLEDVIKEASLILKNGGYFSMVHRPDRLEEIFTLFKKYNIAVKRLRFVYPKKNKECNHILIEGIKNGKPGLKVLSPLILYKTNDKWTKEVLNIYNYKER